MAKLGKRTRAAREAVAGKENLSVEEAVALVTRFVAPDDIRAGQFMMTMHHLCQAPILKDEGVEPEILVLQFTMRPYRTEIPRKVLSVCLPFVVLELADKSTEVVDTRSTRLSRVNKQFAKAARKPHQKKNEKSKEKRNKRKRKGSKRN